MIDLTTFNWLGGERVWMRPSLPGPRLEIVIAGDENGPQPSRVAIAEAVIESIDDVIKQATAYLDAFVDRPSFAENSEWYLDSIEFGRRADEPLDEFIAYFLLDQDVYGLWSVLMRRTDHAGFVPKKFARGQQ